MVKYRVPGIAGSSLLFLASSIGFDTRFEFLAWTERHHAPRADRNLLTGFGIAAGPLVFIAQVEIAEARQLHLLALRQRSAHLFKEEIHELACFTFVETELIEQCLGHLSFGQSHRLYSLIRASNFDRKSSSTDWTTRSASASVSVRVKSCKIKPKAILFRPNSTPFPW